MKISRFFTFPITLTFALALLCGTSFFQAFAYSPAGDRIKTSWGENIDPKNVHSEYPRPIMERQQWMNLNGLWNYAITPKGAQAPSQYEGEILVPFCAESSLSGVGREVGKDKELWYERQFTVPASWKGEDVLLNFGGVDWKCDVWVNDVKVGGHTGAYAPFSFNITPALNANPKGTNTLRVRVWDPTDDGPQPRGKQVSNPGGIWYTPVTGIWQTVWLEPVPKTHIKALRNTPDIDANILTLEAQTSGDTSGVTTRAKVYDAQGKLVAEGASVNDVPLEIRMPQDVNLWSPNSPYLYDVSVELVKDGKVIDKVDSYCAMRKFSTARDRHGIVRLQLNNEDLFQYGPLDQGWWPDGLYTAPSYEAMIFDIDRTKDLGFNMIRKHIKVEPATWYTYCDKAGIIVWQDMPSGDFNGHRGPVIPQWQNRQYFDGTEFHRSDFSARTYRKEWKEIMDALYNYPCIGVWIPFNEAWGQFDTEEIVKWTKDNDPSRLVNPASGGNFYSCGDILDLHNYPGPDMYLYDGQRCNVLGEYGGIGYVVQDHLWNPDRNWGYIQFSSPKEVTDEYVKYATELLNLVDRGFSAGVYTQTTDVEVEVNGFYTYDRKVEKMERDRVREINDRLTSSLSKK